MSFDEGASWNPIDGGRWHGGTGEVGKDGTVDPPPMITWDPESIHRIACGRVRGEIDIPVNIRVGVDAVVVTP